jgi:hypothetical protein
MQQMSLNFNEFDNSGHFNYFDQQFQLSLHSVFEDKE